MQQYITFCVMNNKGKFLSNLFVDNAHKNAFKANRLGLWENYWYKNDLVAGDITKQCTKGSWRAYALPILVDESKGKLLLLPHNT